LTQKNNALKIKKIRLNFKKISKKNLELQGEKEGGKSRRELNMPLTQPIKGDQIEGLKGYTLVKEINTGHFGRVLLAKEVSTGEEVACKIVEKTYLNKRQKENMLNEVSISFFFIFLNSIFLLLNLFYLMSIFFLMRPTIFHIVQISVSIFSSLSFFSLKF